MTSALKKLRKTSGARLPVITEYNFQGSTHSTNGIFGHVTQRALHKKWSNIPKHLMSSHTFNTMQHSGSTRTSRKKFSKDIEPSATSCESCLGSSIIYIHTRTSWRINWYIHIIELVRDQSSINSPWHRLIMLFHQKKTTWIYLLSWLTVVPLLVSSSSSFASSSKFTSPDLR